MFREVAQVDGSGSSQVVDGTCIGVAKALNSSVVIILNLEDSY